FLEKKENQIRDLEFTARGRMQGSAKIDNALIVNIKPRHRVVTLRLLRFFLKTNCLSFGVELDHAITLRIADLISKNASAALDGQSVPVKIKVPVENVVAQNE